MAWDFVSSYSSSCTCRAISGAVPGGRELGVGEALPPCSGGPGLRQQRGSGRHTDMADSATAWLQDYPTCPTPTWPWRPEAGLMAWCTMPGGRDGLGGAGRGAAAWPQ